MMASKYCGLWSQLGGVLTGIAALVTAIGSVAFIYTKLDAGEPKPSERYVITERPHVDGHMAEVGKGAMTIEPPSVDPSHGISRLDVEAALVNMKRARKAALSQKCDNAHPEVFARGEITYGNADADLSAEHYGSALQGFRKAAKHYQGCSQG